MSDGLKPMLLMVCARCREGEGGECHTPGCSFWMHRMDTMSIGPARTREELVEAAAQGVRGGRGHGHGNSWEAAPKWRKQPYRETAERALIAASVIEPDADSQASGEHRTLKP